MLLACVSSAAFAEQATFLAKKDSRIESTDGLDCANNAGAGTIMSVRAATKANGVQRSVVHFDLSSIPHGSAVLSATLNLFVEGLCCTSPVPVRIERLTRTDWTETDVLWTAVDCSSARLWCSEGADFTSQNGITWNASGAGWNQIPLSSPVQEALDTRGGQLHLALRLQDENQGDGIDIRTREWAGNEPSLTVQWSAPPNPSPSSPWVSFREETGSRLSLTSVPANDPEEKDVAAGDFDDDGDEDIIVVRKLPFSTFGPRAPVLLMNEDGVLVDRTATKLGDGAGPLLSTNARDVFVGDLNGDQAPDLVVANTCNELPTFYRNKGGRCAAWNGFTRQDSWLPPASGTGSFSVDGKRFCAVAGGDVDGDGDVDLYLSNYQTVCGPGDGGQADPNPGAASDKDVLLINKIAGADATGRLMDESQVPVNRLADLANVAFGTAAEILDVDRDGPAGVCDGSPSNPCDNDIVKISTLFDVSPWKPNVLSVTDGTGVFVLRNGGDGHFAWSGASSAVDILDLNRPYMMTGADFNSDGRIDFYVVDDNLDSVYVATGPSSYERRAVVSARTGDFGGNVKTADIDDDGDADVGVADVDVDDDEPGCPSGRRFALLQNDGSGNLSDPYEADEAFHVSTHDFVFVDLNGDGCPDLLAGVCSGYKAFINTTPPNCQGGP